MNETITHEGNEYEVLPLDELQGSLSFRLYVRLAGGAVKTAEYFSASELIGINSSGDQYVIGKYCLSDFGIQPLKMLPKELIGKLVGITHKDAFKTAWLTIEVPENAPIPDYYSLVKIKQVEVTE